MTPILKTFFSHIVISLLAFSTVPIQSSWRSPHQCKSCQKKFKLPALALRCSIADNNLQEIKEHIKKNDQSQEIQTWKCPLSTGQALCKKQGFLTLNCIRQHLQSHISNPKICPFPSCVKQMNSRLSLRNHILKHTPFRPFKCDYPSCTGYAAIQEIHVFSHVVTHLRSTTRKRKKEIIQTQPSSKKQKKKIIVEQLQAKPPVTRSQARKETSLIPTTHVSTLSKESLSPTIISPPVPLPQFSSVTFPLSPAIRLPRQEQDFHQDFLQAIAFASQSVVKQPKLSLPVTSPRSGHCFSTLDVDLFPDPLILNY